MADVTRAEFDALAARVTALDGGGPSGPVSNITAWQPQVTISGSSYTITGQVMSVSQQVFTYLQLAVRGPGNVADLGFQPGVTVAAGETRTVAGTATGQAGTYTAWVAYSLDGQIWVDGPKATFTIPGPTGPTGATGSTGPSGATGPAGRVPLAGFSKLPFNSIVFRTNRSGMQDFGKRRGVPMDGLLYFTGRQKWEDLRWIADGVKDMLASGMIVVVSIPHAPENEGDAMNQKGANNAYAQQQKDLGAYWAANAGNVPNLYVRLDWELNGNWYKWSANRPGGSAALKQAIQNCVTNMRAGGLTKATYSMCFNKGPNQAGAAFECFPGAEFIGNIGIDQYDMWAPSYNQSDWDREMGKSPSARIVADFTRQRGITWSWDEGGNTHGNANQGGDNPTYWDLRKAEIMRNISNFAYDNTYDDPGAPATLMHDFARNPKSWAKYQQLYRP